MSSSFPQEMMTALQQSGQFDDCRCVLADSAEALPFPVKRPIICFGLEKADRMDYFLGYDEVMLGTEKLRVSLLCEQQLGGAYCEQLAQQVCQWLLQADTAKQITSVSVEKCMYDKVNFAYKVIMRFTMREHNCLQ